MAKKILSIWNKQFGKIGVGDTLSPYVQDFGSSHIAKIEFREGEVTLSHHGISLCNKESYIVNFEGTTKTLEVFDVNYVIRDDVEE